MNYDSLLAVLCAAFVATSVVGCGDDGGGPGDTSAGTTAPTTTASGADSTTSSGSSESGTSESTESGSSGGMVDPTEGEEPPTFECGGGGVFPTDMTIDPDDPDATPIDALEGISVIDGDLLVTHASYFSLDFLECITEVRGDIQIYDNPFLIDLSGTNNIVKVGRLPEPLATDPTMMDMGKGTITISANAALVQISGFAQLPQIGEQDPNTGALAQQSLVIRQNPAAETITGFDSLTTIFGSLIIQENDALQDIDALKVLQNIGGGYTVTRNPNLCLSSVNCVGGGLLNFDPEFSTTSMNNDDC